ncbi:leucine-rich repeat-containing protein 75A isoform X2 [Crotalus tigris]|uniref:leucine-rich repeat-containing protein 75A isoform X2 n=1 Tax=Crotalus tigris TaxID=88082 RepID=UPI00192F69B5|nr:leucine-rich repeat-containing protein 75A isoform X2 [Crotalus tigris]
MGAKQTKGCSLPGSAGSGSSSSSSPQGPLSASRRRILPSRERGNFLASLVVRSSEKFGKGAGGSGGSLPPYHRRIVLIQDMLRMVKQGRHEEATDLLKYLRQDLGMESTSLDDVLYRYASFRNLVDPITHDLIISLARYIHCPKPEGDSLGAMEKLCRQLTYHLSPHSQWRRQGMVKRKPQACLKTILVGNPLDNTVDLSGIPLTMKELDRLISYLQHSSELTKAILRDLTEALKDTRNFPSMTWIDLGNNVDIFSLPQPFLVSLKKRSPTQSNLPTILEFGEGQVSDLESQEGLSSQDEDQSDGGLEDTKTRQVWTGEAIEVKLLPNQPTNQEQISTGLCQT